MSSHVGTIVIGVFSSKKEAGAWGQLSEAPWILTFSLSKACPAAYSTYKMLR
jgi:hypothetical protein